MNRLSKMAVIKRLRQIAVSLLVVVLCTVGFAVAESATSEEPLHLYIIVSDYNAGSLLNTQRNDYALFLMNSIGVLQDEEIPFDLSLAAVQGDSFLRYDTAGEETAAVWLYETILSLNPAGEDITKNTGLKISQAVNEGGSNSVVLLLFGNDMSKFGSMSITADNPSKLLFVGNPETDLRKLNEACSSLGGVSVAANEGISLDEAGSVALAEWMTARELGDRDFAFYRIEGAESRSASFNAEDGKLALMCDARGISDYAAFLSCPDGEISAAEEDKETVISQANGNTLVLPNPSVLGKKSVLLNTTSETKVLGVVVRSDNGNAYKKIVASITEALQTKAKESKEHFEVGDKIQYTLTADQDILNLAKSNDIRLFAYVEGTDADGNPIRGEETEIPLKKDSDVQVPIPASGKNTLFISGTDFVEPISVIHLNVENAKPTFAEGIHSEENIGTLVCLGNMTTHSLDLSKYFTDVETPDRLAFQVDTSGSWKTVETLYPIDLIPGKGSVQVRAFDGDKYSDPLTLSWQVISGDSAFESPILTLPNGSAEGIYAGETQAATITIPVESEIREAANTDAVTDYLSGLAVGLSIGDSTYEAGKPEITEDTCAWTVEFTAPSEYESYSCVGILLDGETEYKTDETELTITNKPLRWKSNSKDYETEVATVISKREGEIIIHVAELLDEDSIESNDGECTVTLSSAGLKFVEREENGIYVLTQSETSKAKTEFQYTWNTTPPVIRLVLNKVTQMGIQPSVSGRFAVSVRDAHTDSADSPIMTLNFRAVDKKFSIVLIAIAALLVVILAIVVFFVIKRAKKKPFGDDEISIAYKDDYGKTIAHGHCVAEAWGKGDISLLQLALLAKLPATHIIGAKQMKSIHITKVNEGFKVSGFGDVKTGNSIALPGKGGSIEISSK